MTAGDLELGVERGYAAALHANAGGDIRLRGGALPEPCWRVGIQHPTLPDRVAAVVELSEGAVATSGAYARGDHVVDPRTGLPPHGILSVSVVGPDLGTANAYVTTAFAIGPRGPHWTARLRRHEAMTVLDDHTVLSTPGFPSVREEPNAARSASLVGCKR